MKIPITIQKPPIVEIQSNARCNPGPAAGLLGSVAVKICKFTIESETRSTIIATSAPITSVNFVLIFITHFLLRKDNQFYIHF